MIKILAIIVLLTPLSSNAKTLEYGFIGGKWFCGEWVTSGRGSSIYAIRGCTGNNLWDIYHRDDINWKKDGLFHKVVFNEYKPSKNVNNRCGLYFDPKSSVTYNYPKCIKTYKY